MEFYRTKDNENMADIAAQIFQRQLEQKLDSVLGLATGTTPIGLYDRLILLNKKGILDFSKVRTVNLDEYRGLTPEHEQSYRYFMNSHLFDHINIKKENTNVPDALKEAEVACREYDELIEKLGGVDLQLLGIGVNGHIGFDEPDTVFPKGTQCVKLAQATIDANARLFNDKSEVPEYAITMGIRTIMMAKQIVLLANQSKKEIVEQAFYGDITPQVPASVLQMHQNVTVILSGE